MAVSCPASVWMEDVYTRGLTNVTAKLDVSKRRAYLAHVYKLLLALEKLCYLYYLFMYKYVERRIYRQWRAPS